MDDIILYSTDSPGTPYTVYTYKRIDPDSRPYFFEINENSVNLSKYAKIILHNNDILYISKNVKLKDVSIYDDNTVRLYLGVDNHNSIAVFTMRNNIDRLEGVFPNIIDLLLLSEIS